MSKVNNEYCSSMHHEHHIDCSANRLQKQKKLCCHLCNIVSGGDKLRFSHTGAGEPPAPRSESHLAKCTGPQNQRAVRKADVSQTE